MGGIQVKITAKQGRDQTGRFISAVESGAHATVMELASAGANRARGVAPKKSGRLAASIMVFGGGLSAGFRTDLSYAPFQDQGTGPKGRTGQFLTNREDFWAIGPVGPTPATHFIRAGRQVIEATWRGVLESNMP